MGKRVKELYSTLPQKTRKVSIVLNSAPPTRPEKHERWQRANDAQMDKLKGATSHLVMESYTVEALLAAQVTYTPWYIIGKTKKRHTRIS